MRAIRSYRALILCALFSLAAGGCDTPNTTVVVDNAYPDATGLVVYRAFWQAVSFPSPIPPGSSSDPQSSVPASASDAYVLLAPGWDSTGDAGAPTSFLVLSSRQGFELHWNATLHIPVDDTTFAGNCAAGTPIRQEQADFITGRVFAGDFAGLTYDAVTCTTTGGP